MTRQYWPKQARLAMVMPIGFKSAEPMLLPHIAILTRVFLPYRTASD